MSGHKGSLLQDSPAAGERPGWQGHHDSAQPFEFDELDAQLCAHESCPCALSQEMLA